MLSLYIILNNSKMENSTNNASFVNVTISVPTANGKYPLSDLLKVSRGWWVMKPEVAENMKYIFPVKANKVLGVFEVKGYQTAPDIKNPDMIRVNFDLKMIFEGSHRLVESATTEMNTSHFVTKHFSI